MISSSLLGFSESHFFNLLFLGKSHNKCHPVRLTFDRVVEVNHHLTVITTQMVVEADGEENQNIC